MGSEMQSIRSFSQKNSDREDCLNKREIQKNGVDGDENRESPRVGFGFVRALYPLS
jgi:hypothetical protein